MKGYIFYRSVSLVRDHNLYKLSEGFSLIELLISMTIVALLVYGVVSNYDRYNNRQTLKQVAKNLVNDLRFAQNNAISGLKPTSGCTQLVGYQVSFPSLASYAIQANCAPEGMAGSAVTVRLPGGITFSPPPQTFLFGVLTRGIGSNMTITLTNAALSLSYALSLTTSGNINDLGFQ